MLKILDLDGFKYIGSGDEHSHEYPHLPKFSNFRKNCTYIHLSTTDWEKDRLFFDFLMIHIRSMSMVKAMIDNMILKNPSLKTFHIIVRQDDDDSLLYGKETYSIGNRKPKNIKSYIAWGKRNYPD